MVLQNKSQHHPEGRKFESSTCPQILEFVVNTFCRYLQLSALYNRHGLGWTVAGAFWNVLNLVDDIIAFENFAKDNVTAIKPPVMQASVPKQSYQGRRAYPVITVVMKNCDPLVSLPALAILNMPFLVCFNLKFSSSNLLP